MRIILPFRSGDSLSMLFTDAPVLMGLYFAYMSLFHIQISETDKELQVGKHCFSVKSSWVNSLTRINTSLRSESNIKKGHLFIDKVT